MYLDHYYLVSNKFNVSTAVASFPYHFIELKSSSNLVSSFIFDRFKSKVANVSGVFL